MVVCRICKSENLKSYLDLGHTPPADDFLLPIRLSEPEVHYPLNVLICDDCKLHQLSFVVSPEILYQNDYPYESSTTKTGQDHFYAFADKVCRRFNITSGDFVIDIGSNVGVLLAGFKANGANVLGIDPAEEICRIAIDNDIETVNDFFNLQLARDIVIQKCKAKIITGTNVVAHIDDHHSLVKALDILLKDDGVFIFEAPYLVDLLENLEYDTIYHEHLSYLSVHPIMQLFSQYGMEVFDLEKVEIHGGSLRYYISRIGKYHVSPSIEEYVQSEFENGIYDIDFLHGFAESVRNHRLSINEMLWQLKSKGKSIAAVSTPAKGMTLLNYCKIGPAILDFATEKALTKVGRYTPGTHINVLPDEELIKRMPDYALLLAWNFAEEIMKNLREYRERGGKFIIPIPEPIIV